MRPLLAFASLLALAFAGVATPRTARADEPTPPYVPPSPHWYGYQTLATDGAAVGLLAVTATPAGARASVVSLCTYGLGGPIVHFAHGQVGKGFADLGLRVVLPIAGAFLGATAGMVVGASGNGGDGWQGVGPGVDGFVIGGLLGVAGASAIDAALLSYEPRRVDDTRGAAAPRTWADVIQPSFLVAPDHGGTAVRFGVTGAF